MLWKWNSGSDRKPLWPSKRTNGCWKLLTCVHQYKVMKVGKDPVGSAWFFPIHTKVGSLCDEEPGDPCLLETCSRQCYIYVWFYFPVLCETLREHSSPS